MNRRFVTARIICGAVPQAVEATHSAHRLLLRREVEESRLANHPSGGGAIMVCVFFAAKRG